LIAPDAKLVPLDGQGLAFVVTNARVEALVLMWPGPAAIWPGQDNAIIEAKAALLTRPIPHGKIKIRLILKSPIRNLRVVALIEYYSR